MTQSFRLRQAECRTFLDQWSGTYFVGVNGQLFAADGQDDLTGAVSPAGDVAILGRSANLFSNPTVYVLVK